MTIASKILNFYRKLHLPSLPDGVSVMNPYTDDTAHQLAQSFYQKYYNDSRPRIALFGINPGRFGGGVTGVPFTDPIRLEQKCGIPNDLDKKAELSSRFIYDMIDAHGGTAVFYSHFYLSAISPLGFVQNGKNLNYYDINGWKSIFTFYAIQCLEDQLAFPLDQSIAYCIGQGINYKFLKDLNHQHHFFKKIETLPHPRWVMQYRLKRKDEFIQEYLSKLNAE